MNSSRKVSGLIRTDPATSPSDVVYRAFLSNLASKALVQAKKKVEEDTAPAALEDPRQSQALVKSFAEASFSALAKQAALQGYVPQEIADSATLESMAVVDGQINETVKKVINQAATGMLPSDGNPYRTGGGVSSAPINAYITPMILGHQVEPGGPSASGSDWQDMSRYTYMNELGSGGFGKVYLVLDQLLGKPYALKQIRLSKGATAGEIEEVVSEVRALANMSHGNVVRLYSAWAEKQPHVSAFVESQDGTAASLYASGNRFLGEEPCDSTHSFLKVLGAHGSAKAKKIAQVSGTDIKDDDTTDDDDDSSNDPNYDDTDGEEATENDLILSEEDTNPFGPGIPEHNVTDDDGGIVFTDNITGTAENHSEDDGDGSIVFTKSIACRDGQQEESGSMANSGQHMAMVRYHKAFKEDEDTKENDLAPKVSSPAKHEALILAPSARVLCYTMDYHPMNLEHFIFAYVREDEKRRLKNRFTDGVCPHHCGHLLPALDMLSAICDGLCHIHTRKFAHRDIKPANILISVSSVKPDYASFVDLKGCPECDSLHCEEDGGWHSSSNAIRYAVPHVTDFGTAVALGCQKRDYYTNAGTKAYNARDPTPSAKSDIYALGVIALELFSCPATGSERARVRDSREVMGKFSDEFKQEMHAGIRGMTEKNTNTRWGMDEVKEWLSRMRYMCGQSEQRVEL
ncbi:hypothetical protein MKZ38_008011 [Zalerion maritima]|uniref:Protein kinase domain-containing protein n=1 Tax=Zalerion maritima TaxID=339359 RepID=A0AAD5RWA8_9PEZI|nr:hypothetical protein MKZ38_008011 [Zalerion maritima]